MSNLKELIKTKAFELGISKIGFVEPRLLKEDKKNLEVWLSKNFHGNMEWMQKSFEKRVNPVKILEDAKTVIMCALNYYTPYKHLTNEYVGKISRYAWGDDYHTVLERLLKEVFNFLKSIKSDAKGKIYVDTGPVMEKVWAQRSGIGWIGKHTNLITREYGSWIFLGVIITNIEFESDIPSIDMCGNCTKCLEACPTNALIAPYQIDSNKCISYLTIEYKEKVDESLINKFDNWIYGCDICQDVCPWNKKFAQVTKFSEFYPRSFNLNPNLFTLRSIKLEEFNKMYKNSTIKRIKYRKFQENVENILKRKVNVDER